MAQVIAQWSLGQLSRSARRVVGGCKGDQQPPEGLGGVKKDLVIIRAVEAVIAFVIVVVLYQFVSAGVLTSIGESATGWYSQKMDGLVIISVVDTSIKLPYLDRASLPIAPALQAPGGPTASESPAAADEDTTPATT